MTSETDDPRDLRITREVSAPRELVWATLTTPAHLARWWGPSGFHTETHAHDLRPGGVWQLTMHGPDGRAYLNHAVFDEVIAPERLVLRYVEAAGTEPARHLTTIRLDAMTDTRTRVTLVLRFPTAEERREVAEKYGAVEGGRQTLDKLEALLTSLGASPADDDVFVIRRVLAAPPSLLSAAWTDVHHLTRWFHPTVWSIFDARLDLRVGGTFVYGFRGAALPDTWAVWRFTEVAAPSRLSFVLSFADATGHVAPSPFGGPWPLHLATTVTLERHAGIGGGTVLTVRQVPVDATDDERAAFRAAVPSMDGGWGETLDSLAAFVAT